jgi:hypothetical protein
MTKAVLDWSLTVGCLSCGGTFDVVEQDSCNDHVIAQKVFNNDWNAVAACTVTCPECGTEITLSGIEY